KIYEGIIYGESQGFGFGFRGSVDSTHNAGFDQRTPCRGNDQDRNNIRLFSHGFHDWFPEFHAGHGDKEIPDAEDRKTGNKGLPEPVFVDKDTSDDRQEEYQGGEHSRQFPGIIAQTDAGSKEYYEYRLRAIKSKALKQLKRIGYPECRLKSMPDLQVAVTQTHSQWKFSPGLSSK